MCLEKMYFVLKEKIRQKIIFEIIHCPLEGRAKLHHLCQPNGPVGLCQLGGNLKAQCKISKILFPLLLYKFIDQNIFFPGTFFAYPISEQKFTACVHFSCNSNNTQPADAKIMIFFPWSTFKWLAILGSSLATHQLQIQRAANRTPR